MGFKFKLLIRKIGVIIGLSRGRSKLVGFLYYTRIYYRG
jgi:hypothetical protein